MAELIRVERGARPWEPASDCRFVQELNYYDMPLCGILGTNEVRSANEPEVRAAIDGMLSEFDDYLADQRRYASEARGPGTDGSLLGAPHTVEFTDEPLGPSLHDQGESEMKKRSRGSPATRSRPRPAERSRFRARPWRRTRS